MHARSITRVPTVARGLVAAPAVNAFCAFGAFCALCTFIAANALAADPNASAGSTPAPASAPAVGADVAGVVKTVKGTVRIERPAGSAPASIGSDVYSKDRVVTGPESSVGITLRDTTQLSAGANTTLELEQFAFNSKTYDGVLHASVKHGSLAVISGKLAKANPDSVRFSTPTTTLGVRGTQFIIEVGDPRETTP
ncbi:FecR domain-containing protein [Paraburkholderia sp. MMS20-SJTR3]|uniref:FecR domain-containing protein n=1 Tax=Paraburkholderia sejongensis TaxID=2886946 RepID=A0ABS8JRM9_9BURK|nr:FecR domain-containing protein [Paraburkholderia sp. MMS20-SJTR3]MCC8392394.1 FecR domain-containing protein [Paraburkholderia sp. MMS20-SJTR3]